MEIEVPPGAHELIKINNAIQQELNCCITEFIFNIIPDTISMRPDLTTSNPFYFDSEPNTLLGFTNIGFTAGTRKSENPVMITTTDKVHLKCHCVDGSIVNDIREQILFSFNLGEPPGYIFMKEPNFMVIKKKTKQDYTRSSFSLRITVITQLISTLKH